MTKNQNKWALAFFLGAAMLLAGSVMMYTGIVQLIAVLGVGA